MWWSKRVKYLWKNHCNGLGSKKRNLGSLVFVDLRDWTGILQVVFGEEINKKRFWKADLVKSEYCIAVTGEVIKRETPNNNLPTGLVELEARALKFFQNQKLHQYILKKT